MFGVTLKLRQIKHFILGFFSQKQLGIDVIYHRDRLYFTFISNQSHDVNLTSKRSSNVLKLNNIVDCWHAENKGLFILKKLSKKYADVAMIARLTG